MEDFVNFGLAQKLKEKGFREKCLYCYRDKDGKLFANPLYNNDATETYITTNDLLYSHNSKVKSRIDAPTISQVLKWLREKGVDIYCTPNWHNKTDKYYVVCIVKDRIYNHGAYIDDNDFSTYEKAALAGIEYVLDNLI